MPAFADIALPVPLDQPFTYSLPDTLQRRVVPGCRLLVPFGARKLTGVAVRVHDQAPEMKVREAYKLLDEQPVLDESLIALGRWMAAYYCAPFGEALRAMAPLSGEMRSAKIWSLTDAGRDAAKQLLLGASDEDPTVLLMRLLEKRPWSISYLARKATDAPRILKGLQKKGLAELAEIQDKRDPLRASSERLRVSASVTRPAGIKLKKPERELLSFLELHPGGHNLKDLEGAVKSAGEAARALARRGFVSLEPENPAGYGHPFGPPPTLNPQQQQAFDEIQVALKSGEFQAFLLHGVTGSGKTEVYLRSIEEALRGGRNSLMLVPEIALTPAVAGQFYQRFGERVAILHSAFNDSERAEQWRRIHTGAAGVVIGTRSGVFAPVRDLGLIIVDEEHDGSYKQQETPRYNGRDVAVMRARQAGGVVILGSATPSLESRYNVERNKYRLLELPDRIGGRPLPSVELIDMRTEFLDTLKHSIFSRRLLEELRTRLAAGEQALILHNRRGFSSFAVCRACGERVQCVNCSVTLTYHRRDRRMLCHYCNYAERVPDSCPKCGSEYVQFTGTGSERVEDELHRYFPEARVARLDRDTVSGKRAFETILHGFRDRAFDILVGTQMIAKGHDIPNVTLVGVVSADIGLGVPDFRAAERTFQLLTQAAGRAGRGQLPGLVLVQTINPQHYAIEYAAAQDFNGFYRRELDFRRAMRYPPFAALANVLLRSEKQEDALRMASEISSLLTPPPENTRVLGPAEAPVLRIKNEYRFQLLIKSASRKILSETLNALRKYAVAHNWSPVALVIDVDPFSLL